MSSLNGANGFRLDGVGQDDRCGRSVAGAGDVNGDGIDDLIIGAPSLGQAFPGPGESYVVFGTSAGFAASLDLSSLDGANGFRLEGLSYYDRSGFSVAGAGDVNGDGVDDLIVGAYGADPRGPFYYTGESYVVFGSAAGFAPSFDLAALDGANGFRLDGINEGDHSGRSVAGAGDINGDGIDDLIIGAVRANDFAGESYVVFGSAAGFAASLDLAALDGANGFRLDGIDALDGSGGSVAGAGDINGDGIDDLVIGTRADESYVVFGSRQLGGVNDAPVASDDLLDAQSLDRFDLAADNGSGIDRDGDFDDLAISAIDGIAVAPGDSITLPSGLRITFVGGTDVRFDAPGLIAGAALVASFAYEVSDGRGGSDSATVTVSYRQDAVGLGELDGTNGFRLDGIDANDFSGSVAGAGDINGDGFSDLIIGASGAAADGKFRAGESYVVFGSAAGFAASLDLSALDGANGFRLDGIDPNDSSGFRVAGAGDVNGDGFSDLVIGASGAAADGKYAAGESYVVFGTSAGFAASLDLSSLDGANGFRIDGIDAYDISGAAVAGAGDINGDGIDDLIVAAPGADPDGKEFAGESYVVFGTSAGFAASLELSSLDGTNGFRLDGIDAGDGSDLSVAGLGDVNGDGVGDLIVGAPGADDAAGESYVVFGASTGFAASLDLSSLDGANGFRLDGSEAYDWSGVSVAGAGDVNGDGIDDLIVGAHGAGLGERFRVGESYVVFGTAAGFAASLDLAALDGANGFRIDGIDAHDFSGARVAGAGDVNGDGVDDLIIGAFGADPGGRNYAGESYVVFGSAAGFAASLDLSSLDGANGYRLDGIDAYDRSGSSVAGAGDVNGDGVDDLIIGAWGADPDGNDYAGESYVVFGSRTGPAPPIVGGPGPDVLTGTSSDDRIFGGGGDDRLRGLAGDDLLDGGTGRDTLKGGAGDDRLRGGCGGDKLFGGCGRDVLIGGKGNDLLFGDAGDDTFVFARAFGCDRIGDFDADPQRGQDRIDLRRIGISLESFDEDVTVSDLGSDTLVSVQGYGSALCRDVTGEGANVIDVADFILSG